MKFQKVLEKTTRAVIKARETHPIQSGEKPIQSGEKPKKKPKTTRKSKGNQSSMNVDDDLRRSSDIALMIPISSMTTAEITTHLQKMQTYCRKYKSDGCCLQRAFGDETEGEKVDHSGLYDIVRKISDITRMKDPAEMDKFLFTKFKECIVGTIEKTFKKTNTIKKIFKLEYKCPDAKYDNRPMCRECFAGLYSFSVDSIEQCSKALKTNMEYETFPENAIPDNFVHSYTYDATEKMLIDNCGDFDVDNITAALCPSTESMIHASLWLEDHFLSYADASPNKDTRSFSVPFKQTLYNSYHAEMTAMNIQTIVLQDFYKLWDSCFPKYLLRPWINVPGKCDVCYEIDARMKKATSRQVKEALRQCHHMHRGGLFQLERRKYKDRMQKALKNPTKVFSCILDGMDQSHSRCPHMGAMQQFSNPLCQHIQGVLTHGHGVTLYRTFNNVPKGANLTIYTFLSELQAWINRKQCYPEEIYLQVDGGSENANKYVLGILEMLVARKVARKIYYTRLPTGHTHEDIDAVFAHIWKGMRLRTVHTVNEYRTHIADVFKKKLTCEVEDVYVIPDYKSMMDPYIDKDLKDYTKDDDTQHQWRFEHVGIIPGRFPLGCKTTYRAYSADKVVEFDFKQPSECVTPVGQLCGLEPRSTYVKWYPDADTFKDRNYEGFYLLNTLPNLDRKSHLSPQPFDPNGQTLDDMRSTARSCMSKWGDDSVIREAWSEWMKDHVPLDVKTAEDYIMKRPHLYNEPMKMAFDDSIKLKPNWNVLGEKVSGEDQEFQWPTELIAACRPSVACQFEKNAPLPRLLSTLNEERKVIVNDFISQTNSYYENHLSSEINASLYYMHKRRLDKSGNRPEGSTSTNKRTLINYIRQYDKDFIMKLHRQLPSEEVYAVNDLINKIWSSTKESNSKAFTIVGTNHYIRNCQLSQFRPNRNFDCHMMKFFMGLFQKRDDVNCEKYESIHQQQQNYTVYRPSLFLSPVDIEKVDDWPIKLVNQIERIFIPFSTKLYNSVIWCLLLVDFNDKKIYYVDGIHVNDLVDTNALDGYDLKNQLCMYCSAVKSWLSSCNFENTSVFPDTCYLYTKHKHFYEPLPKELYGNSGLLIVIITDFLVRDCPVYFKLSNLNDLRINYAFRAMIMALLV